jgi:1-acyl-sn-glycerol-3-phosphate acyltransferase
MVSTPMPVVNAETPARGELTGSLDARVFSTWRDVLKYPLQLFFIGVFFLLGFAVSAAAPILFLVLGKARAVRIGSRIPPALFRFFLRVVDWAGVLRVRFEDCEPFRDMSGVIVAPNHPGLMDAIVLMTLVPRPICIMRAGLKNNPCIGGAARLAGYITNDRGASVIRQCQSKLASGDNLLIFPEGTRTRSGARGVNPFKGGFALTAVLSGAPIQTVFIERSGVYLGKEKGMLSVAHLPIEMTIRPGEVFHALPGESAKELSLRLETYFRAHLANTDDGIRLRA